LLGGSVSANAPSGRDGIKAIEPLGAVVGLLLFGRVLEIIDEFQGGPGRHGWFY
jgi:hypothetical protein